MAHRMVVIRLHRLTLVRKSKATAKHPNMREGVVEVVKAATPAPERERAGDPYPNLRRTRWQ